MDVFFLLPPRFYFNFIGHRAHQQRKELPDKQSFVCFGAIQVNTTGRRLFAIRRQSDSAGCFSLRRKMRKPL
jgi:hypothetical protein